MTSSLSTFTVPGTSEPVPILEANKKPGAVFIKHDPPMVLGEGSLYRPSDRTLHYLDIERSPVTALYIAQLNDDGSLVSQPKQIEIKGSRHVTAIAFRKNKPGSYLCTTHTGLAYLDEATGQVEHLPNGLGEIISKSDQDRFRFNDGVCDLKGRWYFHSMSRGEGKKTAKLYMYERGMNGKSDLKVLEEGFAIGNGPVIDEERGKFYFNFTDQAIGWVYDYDASTGLISNRQVFFDNNQRRPASLTDPVTAAFGPGNPDGHTLDTRGRVYQAVFSRSCIERFTPDGTHDLTIQLPARCPTCPVFGGKDLTSLYVTTASEALLPGEAAAGDQGGHILRINLTEELGEGVNGIVKPEFAG